MTLLQRMIRAARLDSSLYEEVEKDQKATNQALTVVVIASVASGIGSAISGNMTGGVGGLLSGLVIGIITALVGWLVWSYVTYIVGTRILKAPQTEATYGQLLRTIGFSDSPGVLAILSFIPILGAVIAFVAWIWTLVAMVIAVRQALDFSTGRAIGTCIVGFIIFIIIALVVGFLTAGLIVLSGVT